jgi:hypothetical protein
MAVRPLSAPELAAVTTLVRAGRVDQVPVDIRRALAFLAKANDRLEQLILLTSDAVRYDIAYDAAHDIGEALVAAHGYRTSNGSGQHEALGRYLQAVLSLPPGDTAARRFDQCVVRAIRATTRPRQLGRPRRIKLRQPLGSFTRPPLDEGCRRLTEPV